MNYPQQADGVSEHDDENLSQMRHPRMFNRGASSGLAWIPDRSIWE
jgi:hypothetical protein